jgi:hypothetical protein
MYKLEKERFEKLDEAETILHAAIVESLSPGTVRTINTSTHSGIASLSAAQLVGMVEILFSTPTLQDILNNGKRRSPANSSELRRFPRSHHRAYQPLRIPRELQLTLRQRLQDSNVPDLNPTMASVRPSYCRVGRTKP